MTSAAHRTGGLVRTSWPPHRSAVFGGAITTSALSFRKDCSPMPWTFISSSI
jgi:hypothetical protein